MKLMKLAKKVLDLHEEETVFDSEEHKKLSKWIKKNKVKAEHIDGSGVHFVKMKFGDTEVKIEFAKVGMAQKWGMNGAREKTSFGTSDLVDRWPTTMLKVIRELNKKLKESKE